MRHDTIFCRRSVATIISFFLYHALKPRCENAGVAFHVLCKYRTFEQTLNEDIQSAYRFSHIRTLGEGGGVEAVMLS